MDNRREFLKKIALLSAGTGISSSLPASIKRAMAINPDPGSSYMDAEHVVILMQENRSFDHCFGTLSGVRGFKDPRAINLPDGNLVWLQTNKAGATYAPFHFDIKQSKITWMGSVPHSRSSQIDADNGSRYDQWLEAKRPGNKQYADMPLTMGYYTREDLPFNYAMADAFTICDQHFCSVMSSTWPNRLFMWGGTIRGENSGDAKAFVRNDIPWGEAQWKVFPERLQENGISWRVYQNDLTAGGGFKGEERAWLSNFGCNLLENFTQYQVRFSPRYYQGVQELVVTIPKVIASLQDRLNLLQPDNPEYAKVLNEITKKKEVLQQALAEQEKWSPANFEQLSDYEKELFERAFTVNSGDVDFHSLDTLKYKEGSTERELQIPKGDVLYQFRKDVNEGNLPTVSWLVPSQNLSDHPSAPWYGAWLTSEILDILTKNPEVWKKTIFILTYDENDGYFDHIPPFVSPDPQDPMTGKCSAGLNESGVEYIRREQEVAEGVNKKEARTGPVGLGFRVPMIVASPWSRGGKVCSQIFDHTSSLQFLEHFLNAKFNKQIKEENISEWRRAVCGNLTSVFTRFDGTEKKRLDFFLHRDPFVEGIYNAKFKSVPGFRQLTTAEMEEINTKGFGPYSGQETGSRISRPLPYQLYVEDELNRISNQVELAFRADNQVFGNQSSGAPFLVYALGGYLSLEGEKGQTEEYVPLRAWHFAVSAGDTLREIWPLKFFKDGSYHLRAYGPNGFFREFRGTSGDPELKVLCNYQQSKLNNRKLTGNIALKITNQSDSVVMLRIKDNAYGNSELRQKINSNIESSVVLGLHKSNRWYDFSVTIEGDPSFLRRFAGRVESGEEGLTDPSFAKA